MAIGIGDIASLAGLFIEGVRTAWTHRAAGRAEASGLRDAEDFALRLWGSILFETRSNCERVRLMVKESKVERGERRLMFGVFDFGVSSALMPDFCKAAPTPAVLHEMHVLLSALKRVDFFQRAAGEASISLVPVGLSGGAYTSEEAVKYNKAVAFAQDAVDKHLFDRFNRMVALADAVAQELHGDEWAAGNGYFPSQIDDAHEIDHGMI